MNIVEEINKLITEYFRNHNNILIKGKDAMLRDNHAQFDAIDLVCDIANVYNSAVYQSILDEVAKIPIPNSLMSKTFTSQDMNKLADAVLADSYKGEDK